MIQEVLEVRRAVRVEVGPRDVREREDEDTPDGARRLCGRRGSDSPERTAEQQTERTGEHDAGTDPMAHPHAGASSASGPATSGPAASRPEGVFGCRLGAPPSARRDKT